MAEAVEIDEKDLQRWKLLRRFAKALQQQGVARAGAGVTWEDKRRKLQLADYLSLFLLGLFNPVVETMRGLCAASHLPRVQKEVCVRPVSLASFSEAQSLVDPALLRTVFEELLAQQSARVPALAGLRGRELVMDSTVWPALPRMAWAFWRRQGGLDNAVRMHVEFDLERGQVSRAELTPAKFCERAQWKRWARPGACYIGDRYYSYDYTLLARMQQQGVDFVVRLRNDALWIEEALDVLSPADLAAGVKWAAVVRLGKAGDAPRVRVVHLLGETESVLLATTLPATDAPPALIALLYRHRWQVERYFRWLKCTLGCRHWLAESAQGVAIQVYLALIAGLLLGLFTGARPNRRQMETIQFYLMGYASAKDTAAQLMRYATKAKTS